MSLDDEKVLYINKIAFWRMVVTTSGEDESV